MACEHSLVLSVWLKFNYSLHVGGFSGLHISALSTLDVFSTLLFEWFFFEILLLALLLFAATVLCMGCLSSQDHLCLEAV